MAYIYLIKKQGKIVAKLLPTEARLRDGRLKFRNAKAKQKKLVTTREKKERKKSYSGRLLTASGGRQ